MSYWIFGGAIFCQNGDYCSWSNPGLYKVEWTCDGEYMSSLADSLSLGAVTILGIMMIHEKDTTCDIRIPGLFKMEFRCLELKPEQLLPVFEEFRDIVEFPNPYILYWLNEHTEQI